MPALSRKTRGAVAMVAAMGLFVVNDSLVKLASATLPPGQIIAARGFVATAAALGVVAALGHLGSLSHLARPVVLMRGLLEGIIAVLFITAIAHLPLANLNAILQAASIIVVALAALLGVEKVGWRRWLAVLVGFLGVLLVVKPGAAGFNLFALVAAGSAFLVAVRDLVTRRIAAGIPSPVIAFGSTGMVWLVGLAYSLGQPWAPVGGREALLLAGAGVLVALGNYQIIVAFRDGEVSTVSALRYTVLLFSLVLGYAIWGDWPDPLAMLGAALIVGSGLYAMHRERVRARLERSAGT